MESYPKIAVKLDRKGTQVLKTLTVNSQTGKIIVRDLLVLLNSAAAILLLFPVDRDTHDIFYRLQSNLFDAASLFQTNHVVQWNAPGEDIFFCVASWLFRIT